MPPKMAGFVPAFNLNEQYPSISAIYWCLIAWLSVARKHSYIMMRSAVVFVTITRSKCRAGRL